MYPEILRIGDFVISSYGLMMVVAFLTGNFLLRKDMISLGKDPSMADDIIFQAALGGIIGAKFYYLLENIPSGRAWENLAGLGDVISGIFTLNAALIASGIQNFGSGMVFLGGFIGGMITVTLYAKKHNITFFTVADWTAPYVVLGHGIGRIGCFLVGDDYGSPTYLPWAVSFPKGLPISKVGNLRYMGVDIDPSLPYNQVLACHPTQIYEMIAYFTIFAYLRFVVKKNQQFSGQIIFEYLFLAGFARFIVEFIRLNPTYLFGLSGAQFISIFMMLIGMFFMWKNRKDSELVH
jgi:phosphatidylglycerol:prolipoprotein diacylglycerol transferase